jgi:hypothetical protein
MNSAVRAGKAIKSPQENSRSSGLDFISGLSDFLVVNSTATYATNTAIKTPLRKIIHRFRERWDKAMKL